jgi:hypothetical protein
VGGAHWRSDHEAGQLIGEAVGRLIIEQIQQSHTLDTIGMIINPPSRVDLEAQAVQFEQRCGQQPSSDTNAIKNTGLQNAR